MSWITKWFINNPVAANLLMAAIVISGILSIQQLRVESFPQIAPSSLSVTVVYPGGQAQQIDESITQRIEESISSLSGIKQITSQSSAGLSTVRIKKTTDTSLDRLVEDVRNAVNSITGFPTLAERPQITRDEFSSLAAFIIVSGNRTDKALQPIAKQVETALKKHPKIAKVSNWGSRKPLLIIEPHPDAMRNLGLSLEDIADRIELASLETRSGELKGYQGKILLRGDGYADDLTSLSSLEIVSTPQGTIKLKDIASIRRDYQESGAIVRNNGQNAIALIVNTSQADNLLQVSSAISETLDSLRTQLPDDIELSVMADMAPYIEDQLSRLGHNAWQGLLIVLILLGLFLELKLAFWVAMGIPIALFGTFTAMNITNHSINDITLFGFILVLGILVDDAVVVGEAIHSEKKKLNAQGQHNSSKKSAWLGVHRVSVATVFGVLTTIAAFSPMLWINNDFAKILAGFSAVVIFALFFSLIESKFILPSHLAEIKQHHGKGVPYLSSLITQAQHIAQQGLNRFTQKIYRPLLVSAIGNKAAALIGFLAFFVLAYGLWSTGAIRSSLFPEIPGRYVTVKLDLEEEAPQQLQENALEQVESAALILNNTLQKQYQLKAAPLVNLLAWSDGYGSIEVTAEITREALAQLPSHALSNEWRTLAGRVEGQYSASFSSTESPAGRTFITVSAADRELAKLAAKQLQQLLSSQQGVSDVFDDGKGGQRQIRIILNDFGRQLGLSQRQVAKLAGESFGQKELYRILERGEEIKVILRYPEKNRMTQEQLLRTAIELPGNTSVALGDVAYLEYEQQPEIVYRRNREQVINVYWHQNKKLQSSEKTLHNIAEDIERLEHQYPGITIKAAGEFEELGEVQEGFKSAMVFTIVLIYILLAVPLKSYWQPLIIMAVIPFGFAGAIFGHYLMDLPISVLSLFGMMAMTGIVVNDSLVLMTRFNHQFRAGTPLESALIDTGISRMRAIFLTTITTICGLLPLLSESAEQAQYLKPAAVSLVFGELFATGVTLILIPVLLGCFSRKTTHTTKNEVSTALPMG